MWIVVGVGNPDKEYESTRHNVGFMMLDAYAGAKDWRESSKGRTLYKTQGKGKNEIELLKPLTYVNKSGEAVGYAARKHGVKPDHIIVVHDELDLPLGKIKISFGSSAGGHNGVKSIERALKTKDYVRVRVGISPSSPSGKLRRPDGEKIVDFVLGAFRPLEKEKLKKVKKLVAAALELIVTEGVERAQTEINAA